MQDVSANNPSAPQGALKKTLKKRHILMMSLGGTIGTGLFIGIAEPLHSVGPLGTLLAYLLGGALMLMVMMCLGELACAFPHSGSFQHYALMFMPSPLWSYTIGWLYWLSWVFSLAADLTAAGLIAHQSLPQLPVYLGSLLVLLALVGINLLSAGAFGESEYWLSALKVLAMVLFIAAGIWLIWRQPGGDGLATLKTPDGWFPHGPFSLFLTMTIVVYSFQGVELVGSAAGEVASPASILPQVIKGIGLRVILFYVLATGVLALVYPWSSGATSESPFVWVFNRIGLPAAASLMRLVIFSAAVSAASSALYASSRMLWSMAQDKLAPTVFSRLSPRGVPLRGVLLTALLSLVCLLTHFIPAQALYLWLIASTGQVGCLAWMVIAWCQYRFRQQVIAGRYPAALLTWRSPWFPWLAWLSLALNALIIIGTWCKAGGRGMLLAEGVLLLLVIASYFCRPSVRRGQEKERSC